MKTEISIDIEEKVIEILRSGNLQHTLIIALFEGKHLPRYCVHMPRDPEPKSEVPLTHSLTEVLFTAARTNQSIEDGAIMIRIDRDVPILEGFSYRLYPPPLDVPREKNMGSGYNSAFDFSGVDGVKCVYFINKTGLRKFIQGHEAEVYYAPDQFNQSP